MKTKKTFYLIPVFVMLLTIILGVCYAVYKYYLPGEINLFIYNILFILFVCLLFCGKRVEFNFEQKILITTNFFFVTKHTPFREVYGIKEFSDKGQLRPRTAIVNKTGKKIIDISDFEFGLRLTKNKLDLVEKINKISVAN